MDFFLIEYFFYIFLTPNLTLRSSDNKNHQMKRKCFCEVKTLQFFEERTI
jgi:hypothetical protein